MTKRNPADIIAELIRDGRAVAKLNGKTHELFPVAIDGQAGQALQTWIKKEKPLSVVEIGLGYGLAALNAIAALRDVHGDSFSLHTIDPNQSGFSNLGLQFIEECGAMAQTTFAETPSEFILPEWQRKKVTFDFAIVDGSHRFENVFLDLFYLNNLVKPGGIMFLDDYQIPGVRKAVAFFLSNFQWTQEQISSESEFHQWTVVRTHSEPLKRTFRDFVDF